MWLNPHTNGIAFGLWTHWQDLELSPKTSIFKNLLVLGSSMLYS